jgi:hypothetical protein
MPDATQFATEPRIEHAKPRDFTPVPADFGDDVNAEIEKWLNEHIRVYKEAYQTLFESKVPEWRRLAEGKPKDKTKSFPWPNASNLVIQVIGQRMDDISARVLSLIWLISPIAAMRYYAKSKDPHRESEKARLLEQYLDNQAFDPEALDLYRVESVGFTDSARLGTHFFKVIPERRQEITEVSLMGSDKASKKTKLTQSTTFNGPRVDNCEFESVLGDPEATTWDKSRLKVHIKTLTRHDLEDRVFAGSYDKDKVDEILNKPDRHGPDYGKQRQQQKKGITVSQATAMAEWDVYESNFWWIANVGDNKKAKVHLYCSYHYKSRTMLRQVFNFMPNNACALIPTKLDISSTGIHGRGYADMLESYQSGTSTQHNQRIDARTMAITGIIRSSNPDLDKNIKVYPFAIIPGEKDEIEMLKGQVDIGDGGMADEEMLLRLADQRAGVGPAISGMGTGSQNKKGQYGSMGTLAMLQFGNSRDNIRTSDFRYTHIKIIDMCAKLYGKMGVMDAEQMFGEDAAILNEALEDYAKGNIKIPIRATTASVNKEVEKQNDLLLRQALSGHFKEQSAMIQAITQNAGMEPAAKKWMIEVVKSQDNMMMRVLRNFGYDQPREFVPEIELEEKQNAPQAQGQPSAEALRNLISMARAQKPGGASVPVGDVSGMAAANGGPGVPPAGGGGAPGAPQ